MGISSADGTGHWLVGRSLSNMLHDNGTAGVPEDDYYPVSFVDPGTASVYHSRIRHRPPAVWWDGAWVEFDIMVSVSPTDLPPNDFTAQVFIAQNDGHRDLVDGEPIATHDFTFTLIGDPHEAAPRTPELAGDAQGRMFLARINLEAMEPGTITLGFINPIAGPIVKLVRIQAGSGEPILISDVAFGTRAATIVVEEAGPPSLDVTLALQGGAGRPDTGGWVGGVDQFGNQLNPVPITISLFAPGVDVTNPANADFEYTCDPMDKVFGESFGTCSTGDFPVGTWDITAVGPHTLTNVKRNVAIIDGPNTVDMGTLREGDVNESGGVFLNDVTGGMVDAIFTGCGDAGYNPNADLNNDCGVFINDVGLLVGNFFKLSPIEVP